MAYKIDQAVGYNLKKQRLAQGLTQDALGKLAGMTKQGISNIESGKGATSKTITTIADCLHISPFDLYKEIEPEANINFRRVTSPDRIYFNKEQYSEDIRAMIDNIISDTKDEIYYKAVVPVTKEFNTQNREMLLARLEVSRSFANYNLLSTYLDDLLLSIRKSIYNEVDEVNEVVVPDDDEPLADEELVNSYEMFADDDIEDILVDDIIAEKDLEMELLADGLDQLDLLREIQAEEEEINNIYGEEEPSTNTKRK